MLNSWINFWVELGFAIQLENHYGMRLALASKLLKHISFIYLWNCFCLSIQNVKIRKKENGWNKREKEWEKMKKEKRMKKPPLFAVILVWILRERTFVSKWVMSSIDSVLHDKWVCDVAIVVSWTRCHSPYYKFQIMRTILVVCSGGN